MAPKNQNSTGKKESSSKSILTQNSKVKKALSYSSTAAADSDPRRKSSPYGSFGAATAASRRKTVGPFSGPSTAPRKVQWNPGMAAVKPRQSYALGTIFYASPYQRASDEVNVENIEDNPFLDYFKGNPKRVVFSKYRKYIVVARFFMHCIALPIFSRYGTGLVGITSSDEWISIREEGCDETIPGNATETPEYGTLYSKADPMWDWNQAATQPYSSVSIAQPYCHEYQIPVTIAGKLTDESRVLLQNLYGQALAVRMSDSRIKSLSSVMGNKATENNIRQLCQHVVDLIIDLTYELDDCPICHKKWDKK